MNPRHDPHDAHRRREQPHILSPFPHDITADKPPQRWLEQKLDKKNKQSN